MRQKWADYRVFWREFRRTFHDTGAVLPSGPALAAALTRFVRDDGDAISAAGKRILEVGPGTGAVTSRIIAGLRPDDRLVLVERNEQFVECLNERLAGDPAFHRVRGQITLVHASVEELPEDRPYDLIISGLPLNNFSVALIEQILAKFGRLLAPGGTLSFFEYMAVREIKSLLSRQTERSRLNGVERVLRQLLDKAEVRRDRVWANVPPASVHHVRW